MDANLNIPDKGITAVLGPSGCGKTTLLRALAGLDQYPGGKLKVAGRIWQDAANFTPPHLRPVGYVFQEASLFQHLTVKKNLEYGLKRTPKENRKISLETAIELLNLANLLERKPDTLSGGERQRVAIARALAVSPELLLMDEPLAALDRERKLEIMPYLEILNRKLDIPIVYVSHATDEVARLADNVVLMQQGKITAYGKVQEMFTRLDLPLAHKDDAGSIIKALVSAHDEDYKLTYLKFAGGTITISHKDLPIGSKVRLRLAAKDISLTLNKQKNTSILNIFQAIIDKLAEEGKSQVTVRLLAGDIPIISRITKKSAKLLELKPGKEVFIQVKSVALLS